MADLGTVKQTRTVDVVDVVQHGEKLVLPEGMSLDRIDKVLHQKMEFDNTTVALHSPIPGFVFEAAYAFYKAMEEKYGWVNQVPTPGFFGSRPPATITVEVARGKSVQVPWGRFELPYVEGYLETGISQNDKGQAVFTVGGEIKRKYEPVIQELIQSAKDKVANDSIYRSQAFRIRLHDDNDELLPFPTPSFLDLNPAIESELVYSDDVMLDVSVNLFTPIERTDEVRASGIPLKRGVLLAGDYGVGKTMAAHATALKCVRNGWTYIVCERSDELADVLRLASEYKPAVVFCEDIDRVMTGQRDISIDHILNVIDGVESKNAELMIVLTTNDIDNITPALLRPGRLDAVIYVDKPDAKAAERLARQYGRGLIDPTEDITEASNALSGRIPAVIREAVERAKLASIHMTPVGEALRITNAALLHSARRMEFQLQKLEPKTLDERSEIVKAAEITAAAYAKAAENGVVAAQPFVAAVRPSDIRRKSSK